MFFSPFNRDCSFGRVQATQAAYPALLLYSHSPLTGSLLLCMCLSLGYRKSDLIYIAITSFGGRPATLLLLSSGASISSKACLSSPLNSSLVSSSLSFHFFQVFEPHIYIYLTSYYSPGSSLSILLSLLPPSRSQSLH